MPIGKYPHTKEHMQKIVESRKGYTHSPETVRKIQETRKGYKWSESTHTKMKEKIKDKAPGWKGGLHKEGQKIYLRNQRNATLEALGGKCLLCGFADKRALQIDHINGGGSKERKERLYKGSFHAYVLKSFLAKENKYQLLCANCNWIKRYENKEAIGRIISKIVL